MCAENTFLQIPLWNEASEKVLFPTNRKALYHATENADDPGESIQFDLIQFSKYFYCMLIL